MSADPLLDDIAIGKRLSRSFNRKCPLTEQQIAVAHDSIANDMVRELILANNDDLKSQLSAANKKMEEIKKTANISSLYLSIIDIEHVVRAMQGSNVGHSSFERTTS